MSLVMELSRRADVLSHGTTLEGEKLVEYLSGLAEDNEWTSDDLRNLLRYKGLETQYFADDYLTMFVEAGRDVLWLEKKLGRRPGQYA